MGLHHQSVANDAALRKYVTQLIMYAKHETWFDGETMDINLNFRIIRSYVIFVWVLLLGFSGCATPPHPNQTPLAVVELDIPHPTPAATLPELIANLSSEDPEVRIVSAGALDAYGNEALAAVPALIANLSYEDKSDVRRTAAIALGQLGSGACKSVPYLFIIIQDRNEAYQVRSAAIGALGKIGDPLAVPVLAKKLNDADIFYGIPYANSIALITGEQFTDAGPNAAGFQTNDGGIPLIVIDALKWWEEKGQFLEWVSNCY